MKDLSVFGAFKGDFVKQKKLEELLSTWELSKTSIKDPDSLWSELYQTFFRPLPFSLQRHVAAVLARRYKSSTLFQAMIVKLLAEITTAEEQTAVRYVQQQLGAVMAAASHQHSDLLLKCMVSSDSVLSKLCQNDAILQNTNATLEEGVFKLESIVLLSPTLLKKIIRGCIRHRKVEMIEKYFTQLRVKLGDEWAFRTLSGLSSKFVEELLPKLVLESDHYSRLFAIRFKDLCIFHGPVLLRVLRAVFEQSCILKYGDRWNFWLGRLQSCYKYFSKQMHIDLFMLMLEFPHLRISNDEDSDQVKKYAADGKLYVGHPFLVDQLPQYTPWYNGDIIIDLLLESICGQNKDVVFLRVNRIPNIMNSILNRKVVVSTVSQFSKVLAILNEIWTTGTTDSVLMSFTFADVNEDSYGLLSVHDKIVLSIPGAILDHWTFHFNYDVGILNDLDHVFSSMIDRICPGFLLNIEQSANVPWFYCNKRLIIKCIQKWINIGVKFYTTCLQNYEQRNISLVRFLFSKAILFYKKCISCCNDILGKDNSESHDILVEVLSQYSTWLKKLENNGRKNLCIAKSKQFYKKYIDECLTLQASIIHEYSLPLIQCRLKSSLTSSFQKLTDHQAFKINLQSLLSSILQPENVQQFDAVGKLYLDLLDLVQNFIPQAPLERVSQQKKLQKHYYTFIGLLLDSVKKSCTNFLSKWDFLSDNGDRLEIEVGVYQKLLYRMTCLIPRAKLKSTDYSIMQLPSQHSVNLSLKPCYLVDYCSALGPFLKEYKQQSCTLIGYSDLIKWVVDLTTEKDSGGYIQNLEKQLKTISTASYLGSQMRIAVFDHILQTVTGDTVMDKLLVHLTANYSTRAYISAKHSNVLKSLQRVCRKERDWCGRKLKYEELIKAAQRSDDFEILQCCFLFIVRSIKRERMDYREEFFEGIGVDSWLDLLLLGQKNTIDVAIRSHIESMLLLVDDHFALGPKDLNHTGLKTIANSYLSWVVAQMLKSNDQQSIKGDAKLAQFFDLSMEIYWRIYVYQNGVNDKDEFVYMALINTCTIRSSLAEATSEHKQAIGNILLEWIQDGYRSRGVGIDFTPNGNIYYYKRLLQMKSSVSMVWKQKIVTPFFLDQMNLILEFKNNHNVSPHENDKKFLVEMSLSIKSYFDNKKCSEEVGEEENRLLMSKLLEKFHEVRIKCCMCRAPSSTDEDAAEFNRLVCDWLGLRDYSLLSTNKKRKREKTIEKHRKIAKRIAFVVEQDIASTSRYRRLEILPIWRYCIKFRQDLLVDFLDAYVHSSKLKIESDFEMIALNRSEILPNLENLHLLPLAFSQHMVDVLTPKLAAKETASSQRLRIASLLSALPNTRLIDVVSVIQECEKIKEENNIDTELLTRSFLTKFASTCEPRILFEFVLSSSALLSQSVRVVVDVVHILSKRLPASYLTESIAKTLSDIYHHGEPADNPSGSSLKPNSYIGVMAHRSLIQLLLFDPFLGSQALLNEWNRPNLHNDVQTCVIETALKMLTNSPSRIQEDAIWSILHEACVERTGDSYVPSVTCPLTQPLPGKKNSKLSCADSKLKEQRFHGMDLDKHYSTTTILILNPKYNDDYFKMVLKPLVTRRINNQDDRSIQVLALLHLGRWYNYETADKEQQVQNNIFITEALLMHLADEDDDLLTDFPTDIHQRNKMLLEYVPKLFCGICYLERDSYNFRLRQQATDLIERLFKSLENISISQYKYHACRASRLAILVEKLPTEWISLNNAEDRLGALEEEVNSLTKLNSSLRKRKLQLIHNKF